MVLSLESNSLKLQCDSTNLNIGFCVACVIICNHGTVTSILAIVHKMDADHAATDQGGPEPTAGRDPASAYWPCIETCSFIQQNLSESSRSALEPEPKQWVSIWDDKTSNRTFSSTIQKLASAFALLLCDRPGPDFITACTIEVPRRLVDAKGSRAFKPSYIVRVAQNRQFTDAQINEIQNFVNNFVSVVLEESPTQPENASSSAPEGEP